MAVVNFRDTQVQGVARIVTTEDSVIINDTIYPKGKDLTIYFRNGSSINKAFCNSAVLSIEPLYFEVTEDTQVYYVDNGVDTPKVVRYNTTPSDNEHEVSDSELLSKVPDILMVQSNKDSEVMIVQGGLTILDAPDSEIIGGVAINGLDVKSRYICFDNLETYCGDAVLVPSRVVANNTKLYNFIVRGFELALDKDNTDKYQYPDAKLPEYATKGSAAADFFSAEDVIIPPAEVVGGKVLAKPILVHTGVKACMRHNEVLHLYNRSGNAKRGLVLANSVGVIDSDYYNNESNDGEIMFAFYNFSGKTIEIKAGERIGQGEFTTFVRANNAIVRDTERSGGFGSTGI